MKFTALVVPPGVVTVMVWLPCVALAAMVNVAVICVELTTTRFVTENPVLALTLIEVAPVRLVPVSVAVNAAVPAGRMSG